MKVNFCVLLITSAMVLILLGISHYTVNAQQVNSNVTKIIEENFPLKGVNVNYESPTTILISGDLLNAYGNFGVFNTDLWKVMDLLKNQYGFKLQNVMTSGVGSVGNPTVVYILMTK